MNTPLYISKIENKDRINIFLYEKHYSLIKNENRLFGMKNEHQLFCDMCCSCSFDNKEALAVKSMMLALWDHNFKNSLRIDLWTKDMPADEMKRFFYETLQTMGDSFLRATGETLIVEDLRDYCAHFAEKMGIIDEGKG